MERREFLKTTFAVGFGLSTGVLSPSAKNILQEQKPSKILTERTLGKTGEKLSIVGLGGVVMDKMDPAVARELTAEVVDLGLNYFDVAPSYGNAEIVMGEAIKGRRDRIFLAVLWWMWRRFLDQTVLQRLSLKPEKREKYDTLVFLLILLKLL